MGASTPPSRRQQVKDSAAAGIQGDASSFPSPCQGLRGRPLQSLHAPCPTFACTTSLSRCGHTDTPLGAVRHTFGFVRPGLGLCALGEVLTGHPGLLQLQPPLEACWVWLGSHISQQSAQHLYYHTAALELWRTHGLTASSCTSCVGLTHVACGAACSRQL